MAHFPLPRETFPVMKFAADQSAEFADCRDRLVHATMKARREFRDTYLMKLDARVWKVLKKKKKSTHKRSTTSISSRNSRASGSSSSDFDAQSSQFSVFIPRRSAQVPRPSSSSSCSSILIGVGSIIGSLEDVMLGLTSFNTSAMRFVASYMHNDVLDARVLSTLQSPTEAEPFEYLSFKWMVKGPSFAMKSFIRPRDFVYLESSGVRTDEQGHKVGHLMMHSVELTGCRSLKAQHGIVRGAISFCFLFSESLATPGCVDVFFKGFVDPRGGVTERIALSAAADSIMACQNAPLCARMKKYSWMVREMRGQAQAQATPRQSSSHNPRATALNSHEAYLNTVEPVSSIQASGASETSEEDAPVQDGCCTVCDVGFSAFTVSLACSICSFHVCSSCVQTVMMANGASSSSTTTVENISFCHHCVNAVEKLDSTRIARDDATHTLRTLRQLSGANSINNNDSFLLGASERIKLEPIKKRCQSVAGVAPLASGGWQ